MIKVTADYNKKSAETAMSGRTDELIYEFAMTVRSISNGLINSQPEDKQDAMRHILTGIAKDAIAGDIMQNITEVCFHAPND